METPVTVDKPSLLKSIAAWPRRMYDWVLHWADTRYAVAALGLLAFAESSFFPVPPDVLLIAMVLGARRRAFHFALVCSLASVFGGLAGYGIGALVWEQVDQLFYAYVPGFTETAFVNIQALYLKWGIPIVFTAGFSPIPYKLFTITSGVMDMPLVPFLLASAVGRAGRFFLVAGLLYLLGEPVKRFIDRYFNWLALLFSILLVGGFAVIKWVL